MSERITIEIDDAELEALIGRLDEAIGKQAELTGAPAATTDQSEVRETIKLTDQANTGLDEVEEKAISLDMFALDRTSRQVMNRIPALRDANRIMTQIRQIFGADPTFGIMLLSSQLILLFKAILEAEAQRRAAEEALLRSYRPYLGLGEAGPRPFTHQSFLNYERRQRSRREAEIMSVMLTTETFYRSMALP